VFAWATVAALFLGVDVARSVADDELTALGEIATLLLYLPLLTALFAYSRGKRFFGPAARWSLRRASSDDEELWGTIAPALPLITGAGVAWAAGVLWTGQFDFRDQRGLTAGVTPEFFAQVSQVIPVLLLALVFDARVFRRFRGERSTRWALSVYTVLVLVLGEAMVLSALPVSNDTETGNALLLSDWHEYIAFDVGVYAVAVAFTTLVLVVAGALEEDPEPMLVRVVK